MLLSYTTKKALCLEPSQKEFCLRENGLLPLTTAAEENAGIAKGARCSIGLSKRKVP